MSKDVQVLLTGPLLPVVMTGLDAAFTTHRPWPATPIKDYFAQAPHAGIRGIASNGSHGKVGAAAFDNLPDLEIVANFGVGYDHVDVDEARRRGIVVTNTPDVLTDEVADVTLGLIISTIRQLPAAERYLRAGKWSEKPYPLTATLRGRTVGIIGLGRIGKAIATRCAAFGLSIAYHGRNRQADMPYAYYATAVELAEACDILVAVAPGGEETRHIVDAKVLAALGADGVFINVARGSVVDEDALLLALNQKTILGAGLDVYENEPRIRPEFLTLENAVVVPHVGSASVHTRNAMGQLMLDNLLSWFAGKGPLTPV
jgi:lactate dehydrogenase-like 2-hydroxyacid dehydrogenase